MIETTWSTTMERSAGPGDGGGHPHAGKSYDHRYGSDTPRVLPWRSTTDGTAMPQRQPSRFELDRAEALRAALQEGFSPVRDAHRTLRSGNRRVLLWARPGPDFVDYLAINLVEDSDSWVARYALDEVRISGIRPDPPSEDARMPVIQAVRTALSWPVDRKTGHGR